MQPYFVFVFLLLLSIITNIHSDDCPRIRKAWHLLPNAEQQMFIDAMHILNDKGLIAQFAVTHHQMIDMAQGHMGSAFFLWHRYFIWEFENQVRNISPEYKCFSMPYWDVTTDSDKLLDAYILHSGLGGSGSAIDNDYCVEDDAWSRTEYPLTHVCHYQFDENENEESGCCLKRDSGLIDLSDIASYTNNILNNMKYGTTDGFRYITVRHYHVEAHSFIGGGGDKSTHMCSKYSSEDPIFWLLHTWFGFQFVIWKNCWGYNKIDSSELDNYPNAYIPYSDVEDHEDTEIPPSGLDDELYFIPMDDVSYFNPDNILITPRLMWDEYDWDIKYEQGTFIDKSHLSELCPNAFDDNIILPNSDITRDIIQQEIESDIDIYTKKVWKYIDTELELNKEMDYNYIQSWAAKTCIYRRENRGKSACIIPNEYEKCTDYDYTRRDDISLSELLNKNGVKDNECLTEIRINLYSYSKSMNLLYELCMGDFDKYNICDEPKIDLNIDNDKIVDNILLFGIYNDGIQFIVISAALMLCAIICYYFKYNTISFKKSILIKKNINYGSV